MTAVAVETEQVEVQLRGRVATEVEQANSLGVNDQESYDFAGGVVVRIKRVLADIDKRFKPMQQAADAAKKAILNQRALLEDPLLEAEKIIKNKMSQHWLAAENARHAEQRRLEDAERKKREAELAKAVKKGASEEQIQQIQQRPMVAVAPTIAKPKAEGISTRETYKARVIDLAALVAHVATNPAHIRLLEVNQTALNELARSLREGLSLPGVELYVETGITARRS